jgi:hypothetical protein
MAIVAESSMEYLSNSLIACRGETGFPALARQGLAPVTLKRLNENICCKYVMLLYTCYISCNYPPKSTLNPLKVTFQHAT